ncbi:MAG: thiamine-phosphate kinase [Candidatus Omnitrophica bacterium]|nr:thiamine-phosphate kinase [Candidatus Omnitrophota bacterium]
MKTLSQLGEFNFIAAIAKKKLRNKAVLKGIGDDAAVVSISPKDCLLFTADMLIEDVHFLRSADPQAIGHKALACSLSDIAAMGGWPLYAIVSVAFPKKLDSEFAKKIYKGIQKTALKYSVDIIGGDTNAAEKIIIDVFLCGQVKRKQLVLRSNAQTGDYIFVTGELGGSRFGGHLNFTPRIAESRFLVSNYKLNSMLDISDGLIADLGHILKQSKKGAILEQEDIPVDAKAGGLDNAFYAGEDFELLFTLSEKAAKKLILAWPFKKTKLSCIGRITAQEASLQLISKQGKSTKIKPGGYRHFN